MKKASLSIVLCVLTVAAFAQNDLARVDNISGVYIFSDCTPVAKYEILGEVSFSGSLGSSAFVSGTMVITAEETAQYNDIRTGLVTNAVLANRQVEGVIIKNLREGTGQATMIKFAPDTKDRDLAKVHSHKGILVFTDCKPAQPYTYLGTIRGAGGLNSDYNVLRDKLSQKCVKKYKDTQAIIPHFVTGGKDSAEAIKF